MEACIDPRFLANCAPTLAGQHFSGLDGQRGIVCSRLDCADVPRRRRPASELVPVGGGRSARDLAGFHQQRQGAAGGVDDECEQSPESLPPGVLAVLHSRRGRGSRPLQSLLLHRCFLPSGRSRLRGNVHERLRARQRSYRSSPLASVSSDSGDGDGRRPCCRNLLQCERSLGVGFQLRRVQARHKGRVRSLAAKGLHSGSASLRTLVVFLSWGEFRFCCRRYAV